MNISKSDFIKLDAIRGLAAFYVLVNHSRGWLWSGLSHVQENGIFDTYNWCEKGMAILNLFTRLGHEFVIVFFVLSGFSIAHSLSKKTDYFKFIKKRFIRIYPPYLFAIFWAYFSFWLSNIICPKLFQSAMVGGVYAKLADLGSFISIENTILLMLYVPTGIVVAQFWSLGYEVVFYVFASIKNKFFKSYLIGTLIFYLVGLTIYSGDEYFVLNYLFRFNIYFAFGMFVYKRRIQVSSILSYIKFRFKCLISIFLFLLVLSLNIYLGKYGALSELFSGLLTILLIDILLNHDIRFKLLETIGKFSYTLYISHVASIALFLSIYHWFFGLTTQITNPFVYLVSIPFSLIIAWFSYSLVEKRTKYILDKIRSNERAASSVDEN